MGTDEQSQAEEQYRWDRYLTNEQTLGAGLYILEEKITHIVNKLALAKWKLEKITACITDYRCYDALEEIMDARKELINLFEIIDTIKERYFGDEDDTL
jgi:hypothetical protein